MYSCFFDKQSFLILLYFYVVNCIKWIKFEFSDCFYDIDYIDYIDYYMLLFLLQGELELIVNIELEIWLWRLVICG